MNVLRCRAAFLRPAVLAIGVLAILGSMLMTGCAQPRMRMPPVAESSDVIDLRIGYLEAFERVVRTLEKEGYEIEFADDRLGVIRTLPKDRAGQDGVTFRVAVIVRLGGTERESWLSVDQITIPTFPEDERHLREVLKGLDR